MILQNDENYLISSIDIRYNVLFKPNTGVLFDFDASDDEVVLKVSVAGHNYSSLFYNELYSPINRIKLYSRTPIGPATSIQDRPLLDVFSDKSKH